MDRTTVVAETLSDPPAKRPNPARFSGILPYVQLAAGIVIVVAGLRAAQGILAPLALAVFAAAVSLPAMFWLKRRGAPTALAILLVVLLDALLLSFVGWVIAQTINELRVELPTYLERAQTLELQLRDQLRARGVNITTSLYATLVEPEQLVGNVTMAARSISSVLALFMLILLYVVFVLAESTKLPNKVRVALGPRAAALSAGTDVLTHVQRYLVLKSLISLATGSLVSVSAAWLGVDFALFWGLLAFLLNYIPTIGSFVAAVPGIMVALLQLGPGPAFVFAMAYLVINTIIGSIIDPIVTGQQLRLAPIVVLVSLVFWGWTWGPIGAFLSVPLTITLRMVMERVPALQPYAALMGPIDTPRPPREIARRG